MIRETNSIKILGTDAVAVKCETSVSTGIGIHLVGLPDQYTKESLLRTVTALTVLGYRIPGKKIIINLAPSDLYKSGSSHDLAIAVGILAASEQEPLPNLENWFVYGELSLDGKLREVSGCVQAAEIAKKNNAAGCIIPSANASEIAAHAELLDIPVYAAETLSEAVDIINNPSDAKRLEHESPSLNAEHPSFDLLKGNNAGKRAIEIAAAGNHNILVIGSPGTMKATLAKALCELLPPMDEEEKLQAARIWSAAGKGESLAGNGFARPFRAPHSSSSMSSLLGGGTSDAILPGEVSLAHAGVLCLEDLTDFPKSFMEALRAPLEDRYVTISRLKSKVNYPADFLLAATCLPCPCGYYGQGDRCTCTPAQKAAFYSRISGPIYDSIALQIYTQPLPPGAKDVPSESFEDVHERIIRARRIQAERFKGEPYSVNDRIPARDLDRYCPLNDESSQLLERIITALSLSARAYSKIIRIARTVADLEGESDIQPRHLAEASSFRFLDRMENIDRMENK